jgi:hypothetical protein
MNAAEWVKDRIAGIAEPFDQSLDYIKLEGAKMRLLILPF